MSRYLVYFHPGDPVPDRMKYVDDATDAPDANDDAATLGVAVGSLWLDTTNHRIYICEDASTGAAVWTELTSAALGSDTYYTDPSISGAYEIDHANGPSQDLTMTGNVAFTITGAVAGSPNDIRLTLRQDGTGSRTADWSGMTIVWAGGSAPTLQTDPDAVDVIGFFTPDDGTTYLGFHAAGGSSVGALDDLSDVTITSAASGDLLRFNGTAWVDTTLRPEPMIASDGTVLTDSELNPVMHEVAW